MNNAVDVYPPFVENKLIVEPGEHILLLEQKHWFVFRDPFLIGLFIPFMCIFASFLLSNSQFTLPKFLSDNVAQYFLYLTPIFMLSGFFMFCWKWFLWKRTYYIMTNKRVIVIRQNSLFNSDLHQISLSKVQDVIAAVTGLQGALYGYGNVSIRGASQTARLEFQTIAKPNDVQQKVMQVLEKYEGALTKAEEV